jgi:hypothetical protein
MGWFSRKDDSQQPKGYVEEDADLAEINEIHGRVKDFSAVDDDKAQKIFIHERNKLTEEVEKRRSKRIVYDHEEEKFYFNDYRASGAEQMRRKPWNGKW